MKKIKFFGSLAASAFCVFGAIRIFMTTSGFGMWYVGGICVLSAIVYGIMASNAYNDDGEDIY